MLWNIIKNLEFLNSWSSKLNVHYLSINVPFQPLFVGITSDVSPVKWIITWILISGRDPDHWFSRVSVLCHSGGVNGLTKHRRLVIHIPDLHCQSLGGGEWGQALVQRTDGQTVETFCLIIQRGSEKQEAWKRRKEIKEELIFTFKSEMFDVWIHCESADVHMSDIHVVSLMRFFFR